MNTRVDILVDTSGSMIENGKEAVIKNLIYTISRILRKEEYQEYQVNMLKWSNEVMPIKKLSELRFSGQLSSRALKEYLDSQEVAPVILLISDGNFSIKERNIFKSTKNSYFDCIAVGIDADIFSLKKIASSGKVFKVPDIVSALAKVCNHCIDVSEEAI